MGVVGYPIYYSLLIGKGWLLSHTWSYSVHSTQYAYYVMMMSHILYIYPHHICSISKSCRLLKEEELSCFHPIALHQQHNSHWRYGKPLIFLSHGEHLYSAIVQKGLHSRCAACISKCPKGLVEHYSTTSYSYVWTMGGRVSQFLHIQLPLCDEIIKNVLSIYRWPSSKTYW